MIDETLWTIADVARFLNVTEKTTYRFAQSGPIPAFKVGWVSRFRVESRRGLEAHHHPGEAAARKEAEQSRRRGTK